jgi:hypothetical protein
MAGWLQTAAVAFALALAIPVFAHGCHSGDHDLEPAHIPTPTNEPEASATDQAVRR